MPSQNTKSQRLTHGSCHRTRRIGRTAPITVYSYFRDGGETVCMAGLMLPIIREDA